MSNELIETTLEPGLLELTLNQPESYNALSEGMLTALQNTLDRIATNTKIRVIILAAAGKAFCAGHDLKEMRAVPSQAYYEKILSQCSRLMLTMQQMPQPIIAQVQGIATAAGCQLVAMSDLAVASEQARFAVSGVNLGLFCSTPSVALSRNVHRKQALEMLLTGEFISAQQAQQYGLINHVVAHGELTNTTRQLAQKILKKPQTAITLGKQLFYKQLETGMTKAYELAGATMACNMMDAEALEGVQAFIDKRPPVWTPVN